jgi:hypothetical protein
MTKRMNFPAWLLMLASCALGVTSAQAKYVAIFTQDGPDVVEVGGGTLDVTDLTIVGRGAITKPFVSGATGAYVSGSRDDTGSSFVGGFEGPATFGSGSLFKPTESAGNPVGFSASSGFVYVPDSYVSGDPLSETSTYADATFASLGITPGTYVYSWGAGADADTLTIVIGGSVPEPSTWAMMLIGFAGLCRAAFRRNGRAVILRRRILAGPL